MAEVKIFKVDEPYLDHHCLLGEGPFYDKPKNTLRFVDIERCQLHTLDLGTGPPSHRIVTLDQTMTVTADVSDDSDHFVFVGKDSICLFDQRNNTYEKIHGLWTDDDKTHGKDPQRLRGNDGACDSQGGLWFGVMSDPLVTGSIEREGTLFRFDPDGSLTKIMEPVSIPNGISWNHKGDTMFWTDTGEATIYAFDFDNTTGEMKNQRVFFKSEEGNPDGHARDVEDHIWVALYGASKVVRVDPQGQVVAEIQLPSRCPTCPAFAGEELYITTAKEAEPEKHPESVKYAGALFKCHVGVKGQPKHAFRWPGRA